MRGLGLMIGGWRLDDGRLEGVGAGFGGSRTWTGGRIGLGLGG